MKKKVVAFLVFTCIVTLSACKKEEQMHFDIQMNADSLAFDTLDIHIKEIWANFSSGKEASKWELIHTEGKTINWIHLSHSTDSLMFKGLSIDKVDVLQQLRFVVDPVKSMATHFSDTLGVKMIDPSFGIQNLVNKKVERNGNYVLTLQLIMDSTYTQDSILFIAPRIKTNTFGKM